MSYKVIPTEKFKKQTKKLVKKYPSLINELSEIAAITDKQIALIINKIRE